MSRATLRAPPAKWAMKGFFPAGERSELSRREGGRRAERPAGSYATPDTPCSRTASEGSLLTERDQTVPALRPELDDPNLFGSSNRSVPADRSPRRIATWAAFGVAVPLAFFCTLFFRHRKKSVNSSWNGKFHSRAVVGASGLLTGKLLPAELSCNAACRGAFRSLPAPLRFACQSKTAPHRVAPVQFAVHRHKQGISTIKRMNKGTFRSPIKIKEH